MANGLYFGYGGTGVSVSSADEIATYLITGVYNSTGDFLVGATGIKITGLAWDETTDTLYGVTGNADPNYPHYLVTIDPADGSATLVGDLGSGKPASDISINSSGQIYGWQAGANGVLLSINKATGVATQIGTPQAGYGGGGFVFISDVAYRIPQAPGSNPENKVSTVDLGTGALTPIVDLGGDVVSVACAEVHDGTVYCGAFGDAYTLSVVTGLGTFIGSPLQNLDAMVSIPIPPGATIPSSPANDNYVNATTIIDQSGSEAGTTMAATIQDVPGFETGAANVWYVWTAPMTGTVTFSVSCPTCFGTIWTGAGLGTSEPLQTFGVPAYVTEGVTYHITVESYEFEDFTFTWNMLAQESPTMPPCGTALDPQAFFGVPWRSIVTSLNGDVITLLDRLASNRSVNFPLNAPATATGQLPSDNPQVNIPYAGDDEPFVAQSARLLYMLRREGTPSCWVPRFGGIMFQLQDQAGSDVATSSYTAFDPWQVLYHRPVLMNDGSLDLPGPNGVTFKSTTADQVVLDLITNMYLQAVVLGDDFPEAFIDFGQTAFYTGTMETAHPVTWMNFQQSASIGEALDQLTQAGLCDIWFSPVYDPINRPGIVAELNVYMLKGSHLNSMIMAWDKPPRSLVGIDALYDGNTIVNRAKYFPAQGPAVPLEISAPSISNYGPYWEQSMFSGSNAFDEISAVADSEIILRANGKSTYEVTPAAGRSPIPLLEYGLGDMLPVWASNSLRKPVAPTLSGGAWEQMARVYGIQITLDDNDMERVERLVLSKDSN